MSPPSQSPPAWSKRTNPSSDESVLASSKRARLDGSSAIKGATSSPSTRLASLSERFSFKPTSSQSSGSVFSRYSSLLSSQSNSAKLNGSRPLSKGTGNTQLNSESIVLDQREQQVAKNLEKMFKDVPTKMIHFAVRQKGTFENAADWLEDRDFNLPTTKPFSAVSAVRNMSNGSLSSTSNKLGHLASKREVSRPTLSIREKFSSANSSHPSKPAVHLRSSGKPPPPIELDDEDEDEDELVIYGSRRSKSSTPIEVGSSSTSGAQQKPRRRLVKGSRRGSPIDVSDDDSDNSVVELDADDDDDFEERVLTFLNTASIEDIVDISAVEGAMVKFLVDSRPFASLDDARKVAEVSQNGDSKKRPSRQKKTIGDKIVDACSSTLKGYEAVDSLIQKCEDLGKQVSQDIASWGVTILGKKGDGQLDLASVDVTTKAQDDDDDDDDEDEDEKVKPRSRTKRGDQSGTNSPKSVSSYFPDPPKSLGPGVALKDYQQVGINWLSLLYKRKLSCILADEMGLGKTCQVISFIAHLKEIGEDGPHLVVVPSSTLENWLREFQKFCPSLVVEPYYGSQSERAEIRDALSDPEADFDVIITTYNLACGSAADFSFLKHQRFNVCVYDEGHMLKNSQSDRYSKLMRLKANFRLLLTGTPLQNNLKELISLLAFILPDIFTSKKDDLSVIFKHKAKTTTSSAKESASSSLSPSPSVGEDLTRSPTPDVQKDPLLSEQRIARAKTMMTPFVLRRKKEQVLHNLPPKHHEVIYCDLTEKQQKIYDQELEESRRIMKARLSGEKNVRETGNALMRLRKVSLHHLLFRQIYNPRVIRTMSKKIMKEPQYITANQEYIYEDMEVMTDAELNNLCEKFPTIAKHKLPDDEWMQSGKIKVLQKLLPEMKSKGDRVLIFSQFTQMLDILERVLNHLDIAFLRMDGQTQVDMRQDMIDKFYNETDVTVFLLSTKAGGFGINLTCANTVIIYDLSFNPHDDKQAEDRAHRVGQTRDVNVIRLVTKNTIEENILELANTKLALDRSISGEVDGVPDDEKSAERNALMIAKQVFGN